MRTFAFPLDNPNAHFRPLREKDIYFSLKGRKCAFGLSRGKASAHLDALRKKTILVRAAESAHLEMKGEKRKNRQKIAIGEIYTTLVCLDIVQHYMRCPDILAHVRYIWTALGLFIVTNHPVIPTI